MLNINILSSNITFSFFSLTKLKIIAIFAPETITERITIIN